MKKVLLTAVTILTALCASAQFSAMTTISSVEDEAGETTYNFTDKIGISYQINDKLIVGLTQDGEDSYEVLGRYMIKEGIWGSCIYNYTQDSEDELTDNLDLGIGYSIKVWKNLYADPNYTMPIKADEDGNREGSFNLSFSYKF